MSKILTCAVVDDEPLAVALLASYVKKIPFLSLSATYPNAVVALAGLKEQPVDLLFLDIQMPNLSGLDLAKILPQETRVVFTTAFSQYAVDSYRVNALDYLLKPISYADFLQAANKALMQAEAFDAAISNASSVEAAPAVDPDRMFVKVGRKLVQICVNDILYVESQKDYVKIVLEGDQEPILTLMSLKNIEDALPAQRFMRVQRSFIVQKNKIREVEGNRILFGRTAIPVGEQYRQTFNEYLESMSL